MIDFLIECGINRKTITEIKNKYNESTLFDLSCNEDDCLKIIKYLKEIGIKNIDELLIYEIDIFKLPFIELVKKFGKFNVPLFVSFINDDISAISNIFNVE